MGEKETVRHGEHKESYPGTRVTSDPSKKIRA